MYLFILYLFICFVLSLSIIKVVQFPTATNFTLLGFGTRIIGCVIGVDPVESRAIEASPRLRALTPELAKGLEFDLVVLIDPESFGTGIEGAVDRYVAMTRATERMVILSNP